MYRLVLGSSSLASLELVKVPAADGETALVLVHALAEVGDVGLTGARGLVRGVGVRVLRLDLLRLGLCRGRGRGAAAEEATDGVADGRTYCDTAGRDVSIGCGS